MKLLLTTLDFLFAEFLSLIASAILSLMLYLLCFDLGCRIIVGTLFEIDLAGYPTYWAIARVTACVAGTIFGHMLAFSIHYEERHRLSQFG
jgi:hypothetical protein